MRNFKTIIALLLSLVMIFSLVACGSAEDNDKKDKNDKEKTEQTDSDKDDGKEDEKDDKEDGKNEGKEPDKEDSKKEDVDDYSVAQLVVGKWEAKIDVTELIGDAFIEGMEDEDAGDYFKFSKMYFELQMSFTEDGEVTVSASMEDAIETFIKGIEKGFPDYAEANGIDMEDIYDEMGTDEDGFAEAFADMMGLGEMTMEESGEYQIDGNEIVVDGEGLAVEFKDVNTFVVAGEDFELGFGEDIEFERSGKFNPPDADDVKDNEVGKTDDNKPSKDDDSADIVGEWAAKVDITDSVVEGFALGLGDEEAAEYFDFDKMYLYVNFEFKKNGDFILSFDGDDFVDTFVEGIEDGIKDYADANGVDMDDVYVELETDEDNFAEDFTVMLGFDTLSGEMKGEYEIDGDEIVIEGEGCEFEFDGDDTLLLDTVGLGLESLVEDDMIEFERQ